MPDRHDDAPFRRAVELGQNDAGALHGRRESARLADAVLTAGGVEHQQDFVRRFRNFFGDHAMNLGQFAHQILLRLQSAGGVDDADVGLLLHRGGDGPMRDAGRIAAGGAGDDFRAEPACPFAQLLDRGGAKRVAGAEHDALVLAK